MNDATHQNFTAAEEAQASKMLMSLSGVLMIVFLAMGVLKVPSSLGHYLWYAFTVASFASLVVFRLAAKSDAAKH